MKGPERFPRCAGFGQYQKTVDTRRPMGRLKAALQTLKYGLATGAYEKQPVGVVRTAKDLQKNHDISYNRVYRMLKKNGVVTASAAKSKGRKWVRYERVLPPIQAFTQYGAEWEAQMGQVRASTPTPMRHTDWHHERSAVL